MLRSSAFSVSHTPTTEYFYWYLALLHNPKVFSRNIFFPFCFLFEFRWVEIFFPKSCIIFSYSLNKFSKQIHNFRNFIANHLRNLILGLIFCTFSTWVLFELLQCTDIWSELIAESPLLSFPLDSPLCCPPLTQKKKRDDGSVVHPMAWQQQILVSRLVIWVYSIFFLIGPLNLICNHMDMSCSCHFNLSIFYYVWIYSWLLFPGKWLGSRQIRCNWATKGASSNEDKQSSDAKSVVELTNGSSGVSMLV